MASKSTSPKAKTKTKGISFKKVKKKVPKKIAKVAITPTQETPKVPNPLGGPPLKPKDPLGHLRSPYGGKMSPNDEFVYLLSEDYKSEKLTFTRPQEPTTTITLETPPPTVDTLEIINCDLDLAIIPSNCLVSLVSFASPGCSLSSDDVSKLLSAPNPTFLRRLSLANNNIESIPTQLFDYTPKLLELNLSCNPIIFPTDAFKTPSLGLTLRSLNLESCSIETLVSSLKPLNNLRYLDISSNKLVISELSALCSEDDSSPRFVGKLESLSLLPMASLTELLEFAPLLSKGELRQRIESV